MTGRAGRVFGRPVPRPSFRSVLFALVLVSYALVTLGVAFRSPILRLDTDLFGLHLKQNHPEWRPWVKAMVIFGQRGPATLFFLPVFLWTAYRTRSSRPLVLLGTALVLLNLSVGVVKLATGRLGPLRTSNAHDVFVGGDIYPSGHVSNTVVLYGVLALIAVRHRRSARLAAVVLSLSVGLGTIYLDTHWFSDVVGGWLAGMLVLLALPTVLPPVQRVVDAAVGAARSRVAARANRRTAGAATHSPAPRGTATRSTATRSTATVSTSMRAMATRGTPSTAGAATPGAGGDHRRRVPAQPRTINAVRRVPAPPTGASSGRSHRLATAALATSPRAALED